MTNSEQTNGVERLARVRAMVAEWRANRPDTRTAFQRQTDEAIRKGELVKAQRALAAAEEAASRIPDGRDREAVALVERRRAEVRALMAGPVPAGRASPSRLRHPVTLRTGRTP
jgi:hypothetical protein